MRPPKPTQRWRTAATTWDEIKRWPLWAKLVAPVALLAALVAATTGLGDYTTAIKSGGDIGRTIRTVDDLAVTIKSVTLEERGGTDDITLRFRVVNADSDDQPFDSDDVKFIAGNGKQYDPIDPDLSQGLQPDMPTKATTSYKVPKTAKPKQGFVRIHVFLGDDSDIDVGLGRPPGR